MNVFFKIIIYLLGKINKRPHFSQPPNSQLSPPATWHWYLIYSKPFQTLINLNPSNSTCPYPTVPKDA